MKLFSKVAATLFAAGMALAIAAQAVGQSYPSPMFLAINLLAKMSYSGTPAYSVIGPCDGTTDLTSAFNAAVAALPSNGGHITFAAGKCRFNSPLTVSYPTANYALTVSGQGEDETQLYWPSTGGGLTLYAAGPQSVFNLHDFSIVTDAAGGGTGLSLNNLQPVPLYCCGQSVLKDVAIRGTTQLGNNYWTVGLENTGWSFVNYDNLIVNGYDDGTARHGQGVVLQPFGASTTLGANIAQGATAITFGGTVAFQQAMFVSDVNKGAMLGQIATATGSGNTATLMAGSTLAGTAGDTLILTNALVVQNFHAVNLNYLTDSMTLQYNVQGVTVSGGSNITGGNYGIEFLANSVDIDQITISDSQIGNIWNTAILDNTGSGAADVFIHDNMIISRDTVGTSPAIAAHSAIRWSVTNNHLIGAGGAGAAIKFGDGGQAVLNVIDGNNINNFGFGITLGLNTANSRVGVGNLVNATTPFTNSASATNNVFPVAPCTLTASATANYGVLTHC